MTYSKETMCLTGKEEEKIRRVERRILRTILGPIKINENKSRQRMNYEIVDDMKGEDIIKFIKSRRIEWLGHISRKEKDDRLKKILEWKPAEDRTRGRPILRWMDQIKKDLKTLKIANWKVKTENRTVWKKIVKEAKTHAEL